LFLMKKIENYKATLFYIWQIVHSLEWKLIGFLNYI
jgi:hypothetical protein